jgi:hypothetical protein
MITFRLDEHALLRGQPVCEVWQDGEFIAALYATGDGVKLVSKYVLSADLQRVAGREAPTVTELRVSITVTDG